MPAPTDKDLALEVQVAKISSTKVPGTLSELLKQRPTSVINDSDTLSSHQQSDHDLHPVILYLKESRLTVVSREAKKKQHVRTSSGLRDHYSELFTRMAALKF